LAIDTGTKEGCGVRGARGNSTDGSEWNNCYGRANGEREPARKEKGRSGYPDRPWTGSV